MFSPDEIVRLRQAIAERTRADARFLDALREEVCSLRPAVRTIRPRSATSVSLVASDGGNNMVDFDPFCMTVVRIVDSYGKELLTEVVSSGTDPAEIGRAQFHADGSAATALGVMMHDLGVRELHRLSWMIPPSEKVSQDPAGVDPNWVQAFREIAEWAVLYDLICHNDFGTDTLVVFDGLLRSKVFRGDLFIRWRELVWQAIERTYREHKRTIYLIGLAKRSKVIDKYNLAMSTERLFPSGESYYVRIPREMERTAYTWPEYARGPEARKDPGEVAGDLYFVRFGTRSGDPIWPVDIFSPQSNKESAIFGLLLSDAIDGFPIPYYPRCLQRAHEHAQLGGFDFDLLQDSIYSSIAEIVPENRRSVVDEIRMRSDVLSRRYR